MSDGVRRLRLLIAYDGRPFCGWQSQKEGNSVQDHLQHAFAELTGAPVHLHGSGRTDAGVHALGQVAHVDLPADRLPPEKWLSAVNRRLPDEIRLLKCRWSAPRFHARFDATGKIYRYRIWNGPVLPPLEIGRAWHLFAPIDLALLRAAAEPLLGTHDFGGFAANRGRGGNDSDTVRTLRRIAITGRTGGLITLTFEGDGFLYRMVRLLTGSLVRCGQGKAPPEWLHAFLTPAPPGPDRPKTSFAAEAHGLYLTRVLYGTPPLLPGSTPDEPLPQHFD
ncbi:MAG TPA: tRNA pseudouridine(38-40) synthase TruA [Chthoniobacteraceae bacterium]|nr:tRNA pseudouridine(38-40) synthase TruA [Chthoniobacteraceae bacterium]